jgi:predicted dehydrogenase
MSQPSRRAFLKASTVAVFATPAIQAAGANEKLGLGVIGCGGRGTYLISEAMKLGHRCVALCDAAEFRLDKLSAIVEKAGQDKPETYSDYRRLLDHRGLDGVIVATPDHHHREHLIAAVEAEKDVYVEKPLTKTIDEGKEMIEAVRKAKRIVQVGNQRHSGPHWRHCREAIQSSDFGDLVWVKVWDCRNWVKKDPFAVPSWWTKSHEKQVDWDAFLGKAPKRAFDPVRYWGWRWYWDYAGGLMTDIGAHQLDIVQWLGGVNEPKSVVANGGKYHFKHWETPDVVHGVWDYGKYAATFNVEFVNGADGVGAAFYGTRQTVIADADKEIRLYDTIDKITPDMKPIESWPSRNETDLHVKNWVECVKNRREPNSPIELGHRVILAAHLANLSYRTGKKVFWDADRQEVIGG